MINWMADTAIVMRRHPDAESEPELILLEIAATNGAFASRSQFFTGASYVESFGVALSQFPASASDRPTFLNGGECAGDQSSYLSITAFLEGSRSALGLHFKERGYHRVFDGEMQFSILVEVAAINRLGALIRKFSKLQHCDLIWTPHMGELFEDSQWDAFPHARTGEY